MRVLMVAPEAVPYAKTGGLADVVGSIPRHLRAAGHDVRIFMPLHRVARARAGEALKPIGTIRVDVAGQPQEARILEALGPGDVSYYFVECDKYFDRDHLYTTREGDYPDNAERFVFFSRSVLEALPLIPGRFDILHVHDWQDALVPVYLREVYDTGPGMHELATVLTIHNLAYQGLFWHWDMKLTGLPWSLFNPERLEFYGKINFLKGGIVFSDAVTTVSRTYAKEIQTVEFGAGLEGVIRNRQPDLFGIVNGVDYTDWSPETDKLLPARYSVDDLAGKFVCKEMLQKEFGLSVDPQVPVLGMVTRLDDGKGLDIVAAAMDEIMALDLELVILGTGHEKYHRLLADLAEHYRHKLGVRLAFDNALAHLVEAGADMFLMPSRYEPCGLNQLYSLRYGTVPIVRATGGLADTIADASRQNGEGANGFSFQEYSAPALAATVARAATLFGDKRRWKKLMTTGMGQDWSWSRSAREYETLYQRVIEKRRNATGG